jgi:hypothetical protein
VFLKVLTTAFVVCGLVMVFMVPYVLDQRPVDGTKLELARFGTSVLLYFGLTCFVWIGAAICSVVLLRRARVEFLGEQGENIKGLIEGTLKDHERKQ